MTVPPPKTWVHVHLMSGDVVVFRGFEVLRMLVHRYMLLNYVALALLFAVLGLRAGPYELSVAMRTQVAMFCILIGLAGIMLVPTIRLFQLRRTGGTIHMWVSVHLAFGTVLAIILALAIFYLPSGMKPYNIWSVVVVCVFFYVLAEAFVHYLLLMVVPRVLRDLRGETPGRRRRKDEETEQAIQIKDRIFAVESLWHIQADGNYIQVRTADDRHFLPGPFGPVAEALPKDLGMQVSRSDWVARAAVAKVTRNGRSATLELLDGTEVQVAQVRRKAVLDWIKASGQGGGSREGSETSSQTG